MPTIQLYLVVAMVVMITVFVVMIPLFSGPDNWFPPRNSTDPITVPHAMLEIVWKNTTLITTNSTSK